MPTFDYRFTVDAPLAAVSAFHEDTRVLKKLTPFPIVAQVHSFEPLAEGSRADFTLWFGPLPVRWQAVHSDVSLNGFTDTQVSGPLKAWRHTHGFAALPDGRTEVREHIKYTHDGGGRGLRSRLLFAKPGLFLLFTARKFLTRHYIRQAQRAAVQAPRGS